MGGDLMWPLVCLACGLLLVVAEAFIPSGGLLGVLSAGLLLLSLWLAFQRGMMTGLSFLVALAVFVPMALALALSVWPHTPIGRRMLLAPPDEDDLEIAPAQVAGGTRLEHLIGQYGRTLTPLRPSGVVDIQGRRIDAMSEEGLIASGTLIRAIQLRAGQLVVRVASTDPAFQDLVDDRPGA